MKARLTLSVAALALTGLCLMPVTAGARDSALARKEIFSPADAVKAQVYMQGAMSVPMPDLLKKADIQHPDVMLEYGLGLYLGRESVSAAMPAGEREKLKSAYRGVLDLYLNASDKFGKVTFDEDEMLDNGDFWVYLAQHIGRPKERQTLNPAMNMGDPMSGQSNIFMEPSQTDESSSLNLNVDLVLKRPVVNAAITCATSARSFARMKKAQMVDVAETKLTPEKYAEMKVTAARLYRASYQVGIQACASRENFMAAADYASQHLGKLGELKDDPNAKPVDLSGDAPTN